MVKYHKQSRNHKIKPSIFKGNIIKNIFTYTALLALFICFGGCVNEDKKDKRDTSSLDCAKTYFDTAVSNVIATCASCHSIDGEASATRLIFKEPLNDNKNINFETLKSYIEKNNDRVILKGSGELNHGGGTQLSGSSIVTMQTFVDYVKSTQICISNEAVTGPITTSSITLLSPEKTLRNASFKLQGKAPSLLDLNKSVSIENIDAILDRYMQSDVFYSWLRQNFNDFLLTDFYTPGTSAISLLNSNAFPERTWYNKDGINLLTEYNFLDDNTNYAIAREPIELMVHVIKEGRPFSEILTADYVMVNPYSAKSYSITDLPVDFAYQYEANLTKSDIETKYPKDNLIEAKIPGIPHAGVLTTITFLNRFPSTATNLDRHRSAKTQLFFLDTDILGLANRPINSTEVVSDTATWTNQNCTVCHNVMEPIASAFKNWDGSGRYVNPRPDAVQPPGLSLTNRAPASASNNLLQWLASEIVKDDRFAMASVKIFLKAVLGRDALKTPSVDDVEYAQKLQAYNYEKEILNQIKIKFVLSNMDVKVIIKEIIKSPLFRASASVHSNTILSETLGQAHLITPEELNRKIYDVMGYYWHYYSVRSDSENNNSVYHRLLDTNQFKILYGGMNSGSVSKRVDELNGVMANIQLRMALQMSCYPVTRDFFFEPSERKLFPYITTTLEPTNEFFIAAIKKNIQYLHKHILGEDLAENDIELQKTYQLFLDTYTDGKDLVINALEPQNLMNECDLYNDPITWASLTGDTAYKRIYSDPNYVIRSWQAVVAYLLSDFKFVYENSAE